MGNIVKKRHDWILGVGGNETDFVSLIQYKDLTVEEMKQVIVDAIEEAHSDDCYNYCGCEEDYTTCKDVEECQRYYSSTEKASEVDEYSDGTLYGYINFDNYHLDYTAQPLSMIYTVERKE